MARNHRAPLRRLKRRLRHAWRAKTGRELRPRKWVFVLGCYNSGTTLLVKLLNSHPELDALPREGVELTDRLPRPEQFGWPRMWQPCVEKLRVDATDAERAVRIKKQWSHYVDDAGIIVEKSPANLLRLSFLQRHFRPAYFIHIVRNGYAVAEGIRRKADLAGWGNRTYDRYPIKLCAAQWVDAEAAFTEQRPRLDRSLTISYEALTDDVGGVLGRVRAFLDIDEFPDDLGAKQWRVHERTGAVANLNADAIARLSIDEVAAIKAHAGPTLAKHGYEPR